MNKILEIKFGSHLYGTDTKDSDLDYKAIYIPTARQIVLRKFPRTINQQRPKKPGERNTKDDIDIEVVSFDRYLELLAEGQTMALDMLFATPDKVNHMGFVDGAPHWAWLAIQNNKDKLLCKNVNAFVGYARQQAAKYGIKGSRMDALKRLMQVLDSVKNTYDRLITVEEDLTSLIEYSTDLVTLEKTPLLEWVFLPGPDKKTQVKHLRCCGRAMPLTATVKLAKECYGKILDGYGARAHKAHLAGGKDYKALSHAVRVNEEAIELLQTGNITFPRPNADYLRKIKLLEVQYEEIAERIEQGLADLLMAQEQSTLREAPDQEFIDDLVEEVYTDQVVSEYQRRSKGV